VPSSSEMFLASSFAIYHTEMAQPHRDTLAFFNKQYREGVVFEQGCLTD